MSKTVFISREIEENALLAESLRASGLALEARSMIRTEAVSFEKIIPPTDWIFFSSTNAVNYFFANKPVLSGQRMAALGKATAGALEKYASVDFMGQSIDPKVTAHDFAVKVDTQTVLFPVAEHSLRTIQGALPDEQVVTIICYRTTEAPSEIGYPDVLVFSSPSNVSSFFRMNRILDYQRVIAYGASTAEALQKHGVQDISIPASLDDAGLVQAINEVSGS
jgi:hydroxymethylbilane synthase